MSVETHYREIGKFIYGAFRRGGDVSDVYQWMAADLGIAPSKDDGNTVLEELYAAFFFCEACDGRRIRSIIPAVPGNVRAAQTEQCVTWACWPLNFYVRSRFTAIGHSLSYSCVKFCRGHIRIAKFHRIAPVAVLVFGSAGCSNPFRRVGQTGSAPKFRQTSNEGK
jgi:hypothetical protein